MKSGILFYAFSPPALGLGILTHHLRDEGGKEKGECCLVHLSLTPRPTQTSNSLPAGRGPCHPRELQWDSAPLVGWAWSPMLCPPRAGCRQRE